MAVNNCVGQRNVRGVPKYAGTAVQKTRKLFQDNIMLNSVRQHNCFIITQGSYIGYMFRLLISHLQAYSS